MSNYSLRVLASLTLLAACGAPNGAPPIEARGASTLAADSAPALDQRLRAFLVEHRIPGLAVAVGRRDEIVWSGAYGVADLETREPITSQSVFPLGSTSKPLTSLVLGQLVEEGRLDLDAPIQTYVPYFPLKQRAVTARLLAGHLAGLRDYDHAAGEYDNQRRFETVREAIEVFAGDPLLFEPGARHSYSAYSFVLLSGAIEGAAGAEFLSVLAERLSKPLGLERTGPNLGPPLGLVTSYAAGPFGRIGPARVGDPSNKWAAGGLVSTPLEMVRLGNALLAGRIVKRETLELLTTPQRLADGSDSGAGYGLGWRRSERTLADGRVVPVAHHGGVGPGSLSFFAIYPTESLVVSLQCNLRFEPFTDFSSEALAVAETFLAERE